VCVFVLILQNFHHGLFYDSYFNVLNIANNSMFNSIQKFTVIDEPILIIKTHVFLITIFFFFTKGMCIKKQMVYL